MTTDRANLHSWTITGIKFHPFNPHPVEICLEDIARGLSKICRFTGQIDPFYSVAEHSVEVMHLVPQELKLAALLHDASEAYLSDLSRPFKLGLTEYRQVEVL